MAIGTAPSMPMSALGHARRGVAWVRSHVLTFSISAVLLWIVGIPLVSVVLYSFREGSPVDPGGFTLQNYARAYGNPQTATAFSNTLIYALVVSVLGIGMATVFAWLIERTDMPGRNFAWVMMLLPIAMPGMLSSMAWILLLSEKIGIINIMARAGLGLVGIHRETGPFNIYSLGGMIFIEAIRGSTTLFLMMVAAFRLMDPAMEEAASIAGARARYTFRKVTLGLMVPAILAASMYALIGNLDDLETPLLIGLPAGIFLLPTLIYFTAAQGNDWGLSSAYTSLFLVMTIGLVIVYYRVVLRRTGKFATITGKAYRPRRMKLGRWRWPALGLFVVYFTFTILLPALVLLWASLLPAYEVPSTATLQKLTFDNYATLFTEPGIVKSVWNTIVLAVVTASATMGLAFMVSWIVIRQRVKGGLALDAVAFVPHAVPSVAVGVALVAFYLNPWVRWLPIYGTITIMVLALMTRYMAFASRTSNSAMTQLGAELEEVAYVSGISRMRTFTRITLRLLGPAFVAGWIWVAAHTARNLSIPLLLATKDTDTIATKLYFYWSRKADFSLSSALGISLLLFLSVVTVFARKFVVAGFSEDT